MKDAHYIAIAKIQEAGGLAAIIDLGKTIDVEQGKKFGVNFDDLLVSQPDTLQVALVTIGTLIKSGEVEWIGIDTTNWEYDSDKEGAKQNE